MTVLGTKFSDSLWVVPVAVAVTVIVAFTLRWLVRRGIDKGVGTLTAANAAKRRARAKASHDDDEAARLLAERTVSRARTVGALLKSVTTFVILGIAAIIVLSQVGLDVAPLIASAGVVGIAVGFGAQSLIKDFLTGVFMIFEDQYGVGDVVDTGQAAGVVEDVGLRVTQLRDDNGVIWYVPNGSITRVGNKSQGWAVADVEMPVGLDQDLDRVEAVLTQAAAGLAGEAPWSADVLDEPPAVTIESITTDAVLVRVRLHTQPLRQAGVARELRVRAKRALEEAGLRRSKNPPEPSGG
jgi:moderate conductance mechanosensitive channel